MSHPPVHFEVFLRRTAASPWALEMASEDKAQALSSAERALADGKAVAARVTRETLDASTGQYRSLMVFNHGEEPKHARRTIAESKDKPLLCAGAHDLYTVYAREKIARLLEGWLRNQQATAFELLHRPDLVERLDATGLELQHAIQKIAIPEAHDRGVSVHEVIREYQKLIELGVTRLLRDNARGLFPSLASNDLAGCVRRAMGSGDPGYVLGVAVCVALAGQPNRRARIEALLDLAEAPLEGPERAVLMQVVEQLLGEILELRETLAQLVGEPLDLGGGVALTLRLVAEDAVETLTRQEPKLAHVFPPAPDSVSRLARWLRAPEFAGVAAALARRALADLQSPRRLHPDDPVAEIMTLRALARVLIRCPKLVSPDDVQETFVGRSRHLVNPDFVKVYVAAQGEGALREAQMLLSLAENVAGAANRRAVGGWLKTAVSGLRFEREILNGTEPPAQRLAHLAELGRGPRPQRPARDRPQRDRAPAGHDGRDHRDGEPLCPGRRASPGRRRPASARSAASRRSARRRRSDRCRRRPAARPPSWCATRPCAPNSRRTRRT